jgi:nucleoside-diphosphate-sugar epimerase
VPKPVQSEDQMRLEEVFNVIADISRARREFGWEPRVTFRDGLRETLAWNRGAGVG